MKAKVMIGVLVGMVVAASAFAADGARKEAVLDTGKGGVKVVMSVPDWADGPYDFAKNPGPRKATTGAYTYGESMFNAPVGESGVVVYQTMVMSLSSLKQGEKPITAEHLASEMLKGNGFTPARAVKIESPDVGIDGATVIAYKANGASIYDGKAVSDKKEALVVMAVSMPDQKRGFAIMATVYEKNVAKFDADPAKVEKRAINGFADLFKNSNWSMN